jgi:hypothetical protein
MQKTCVSEAAADVWPTGDRCGEFGLAEALRPQLIQVGRRVVANLGSLHQAVLGDAQHDFSSVDLNTSAGWLGGRRTKRSGCDRS